MACRATCTMSLESSDGETTGMTVPRQSARGGQTSPRRCLGEDIQYAAMRSSLQVWLVLVGLGLSAVTAVNAQRAAESRNMVLVGHNDLSRRTAAVGEAELTGVGDGGEGLALQQWPDGRRLLYLAHEAPQRCLSIIDVTKPEAPVLLNQLPSPTP